MSNASNGVRGKQLGAFVAWLSCICRGLLKNLSISLVALAATVSAASAETLLMPKRDARIAVPVVVWGVTTQANGTNFTLDYGDATAPTVGNVADRSYIAFQHTYANQGTYTVTLTVGAETTTTTVQVFNPALMIGGAAGDNNRSLGINMAIQDGLRYLWTSQSARAANFPASITTHWGNSFPYADASLIVLAFENQGYKLNGNSAPTGIYEKYIVRRGLNYVLSTLVQQPMGLQNGNNPCVIYADCVGLRPPSDPGYSTAVAILGFAGSGALTRVNNEVAGYTNGKTYGEILQRLVNAQVWGQSDSGVGRGGWRYNLNETTFDGSTAGWAILAFLDAMAAGATVPAFAIDEFKIGFNNNLNTNGSFDYTADGNPASESNPGPQKVGIGLQGLFLIGETAGPRVDAVRNNVNSWWNGLGGIGQNPWGCGQNSATNKGCAYSMYNNFKGLKLQNIVTLPNVTRPAGPGAQPAGDWYADYQDWLVLNQAAANTTAGGSWGGNTMGFSCCYSGDPIKTAIAELILSPVALVAPDPTLFSTVGLSPLTAVNPVGTSHTVTAFAQAANGAPVPGATVVFNVLTGPNTGKTGTGTTGADGKTSFTYADDGGAGVDTIQAFIGALGSNVVTKTWGLTCDVNNDSKVTQADLVLIRAKNGQAAAGPADSFDPNGDGVINVADVRYCQLRLTPP